MREKGITELDVWNVNETGFRIGCGNSKLVVTMDINKPLLMIDLENRNYITSAECIGSASETIPPMFLISGVNILYKRCQNNDLGDNIVTGTSVQRKLFTQMMILRWNGFSILPTIHKINGA